MKKKKIVKINESQLMNIVKESVKNILKENAMNECGEMEEGLDEGFFNNLKTGTKTFFQKSGKGLKDRFSDVKKNFATQGEYDELDKRKINPNMTVSDFRDGFARVELNGKENFIDKKGKLLSKQWFDKCEYFYDGFASVRLNGKENYIDKKGNLLSKKWFDEAYNFSYGLGIVNLNGEYNWIDKKGRIYDDTDEHRKYYKV